MVRRWRTVVWMPDPRGGHCVPLREHRFAFTAWLTAFWWVNVHTEGYGVAWVERRREVMP